MTAAATAEFRFETIKLDEFLHHAIVWHGHREAFRLLIWAPMLLEETIGSGQYITQLERIAPALRERESILVADAGANVGLFSLLAQSVLEMPVRVAAFEPLAMNCFMAAHNMRNLNHMIYRFCLGDDQKKAEPLYVLSGTGATLHLGEAEAWMAERGEPMPPTEFADVFPLDAVRPELGKIDLLKLDVEGSEQQVLEGAWQTIREDRPFVICSYEHGCNHVDELCEAVGEGYTMVDDPDVHLLTFTPDG